MHSLNEAYYSTVDPEHRKEHGQFFTPHDVALFMCRWALENGNCEVYDPAFGLGAFYFAAKSLVPSIDFSGTELDSELLKYFHARTQSDRSLRLSCDDYLGVWGQTYKAIVCNPPYMRFQKFNNRTMVFDSFKKYLQIELSGFTNIASAFLLKSLSELMPGGRLAYIMPLEFLNTGYGKVVKENIVREGMLKALIQLEPEKEIFPDAITSVGIILVAKDGNIEPVRFYTVQNLDDLRGVLSTSPIREVHPSDLDPSEKWLKYFENGHVCFNSTDLVPIDYYGSFSRGIATGANEFFIMSRSKADELGISRSNLLNCITKSAQVESSVFTDSDFDQLENADSNVLLLNVNGETSDAVSKYLQYGEKMGFDKRYLTKMRTPWYKLEYRKPAPLLFGVFSREKFKVVRNKSSAINLTCYHCFYPNLFGQDVCDVLFLYFQSRAARKILGISLRHYGDGLDKFEPNDLNRALAPSPNWISRLAPNTVENALEYFRLNSSLPEELETMFEVLSGCNDKDMEMSKR